MNQGAIAFYATPVLRRLPVATVRFSAESPDPLDKLDLKDKGYPNVHSIVKRALLPENFLGEGYYKKVFDIPGTEYVLVIPIPFHLQPEEDPFPGINAGQQVASLGPMKLVRKQKGEPNGALHWRNPPVSEAKNRARHRKFLKLVSAMPQKAFDQLAKNLSAVNQAGFKWDGGNPNNLLVDEAHQSLNLIDVDPKNVKSDPLENDNLTTMMLGLTDSLFAFPREKARPNPGLVALRRKIFEKAVKACLKTGLPLSARDNFAYREHWPGFSLKAILWLCGEDLSADQVDRLLKALKKAASIKNAPPAKRPSFPNVWSLLRKLKKTPG